MLIALPDMVRLRLAPFEVDTAESARLALERMASTDYDLKMPDMDGEAFIREARTRPQEREVLVLRGAAWPRVQIQIEQTNPYYSGLPSVWHS